MNITLATAMDLYSQVKQAHWNVRGPWFFARHQLFDGLADHLRTFADDVAERIGTLGGALRGTVRMTAGATVLPEYEAGRGDGMEHIKMLAARYGVFTRQLRKGIDVCNSAGEPVTEDLFTEGLRAFELDMWFLESHVGSDAHVTPMRAEEAIA